MATLKQQNRKRSGLLRHVPERSQEEGRGDTGGEETCVCVCVCRSLTEEEADEMRAGRGGVAYSSLPAAGSFVVCVPVLLLTLDGAVRGVPAAVVHGLFFTVIALQTGKQ